MSDRSLTKLLASMLKIVDAIRREAQRAYRRFQDGTRHQLLAILRNAATDLLQHGLKGEHLRVFDALDALSAAQEIYFETFLARLERVRQNLHDLYLALGSVPI